MIFCRECGFEMPEDSKFCPSCGTPVVKTKKSEKANTPEKLETVNQGGTMINVNRVYGKIDIEKLPQGYEIDNRYKVIEKLGQGSFGAVYKVYDKDMETEKALKIIPEAVINDKEAMLSLRKEAAIMVKLNHKNIVRVYDFHHNGDIKYIDMEYVEGSSLADIKLTKPDKKFTEEEVKEYAIQVLEGLSYAHKKKIIHKDIKPQNLMLDKSGKVKIMDFGIAETVHSSMSRLKNTGSSGTLVYMSPEQLRGKDVGKEADIYSLGASMYELLSGQPPFHKGDITYQIINEKPEKIKGISYQMNSIIQKSLKKDMKDRYLNCDEFKKALIEKQITEKEPKEELKEENKINEEEIEKEIIEPQQTYEQTQDKTITKQKEKKSHTGLIIFLLTIALIIFGIVYYNNKREQEIIKQQETEQQQLGQEQKDKEEERIAEQQRIEQEQKDKEEAERIAEQKRLEEQNKSGTFTDSRDGQEYKWVRIGEQVWMAENLAYKASSGCWAYNNNSNNVNKYGYLYNWETAKKVCPDGWHLPSKSEFETLLNNYGGSNNSKANYTALIPSGNSGFSALFGGWRNGGGRFDEVGNDVDFWSSSAGGNTYSWYLYIYSSSKRALMYNKVNRSWGFSVRCLQDY